jgi:Sec-independent protein translocase protein TatA
VGGEEGKDKPDGRKAGAREWRAAQPLPGRRRRRLCCRPVIAFFGTLGFSEMVTLLVVGILLFGRNLPEVGRTLGKTLAQLRRGFQDFKEQIDREADLREVKNSVKNTVQELRRVSEVPRAIANPIGLLQDLTNEALSSPIDSNSESAPAPKPNLAGPDLRDTAPPAAP